MPQKLINIIGSIAPWAPIPLFAENQRSQRELVSAVLTRTSLSACLTGCIRDFDYLWNIDYIDLFGSSQKYRPTAVASLCHGNSFDLANEAALENVGIICRHGPGSLSTSASESFRPTVIHLSFVTPSSEQALRINTAKGWATLFLFPFEIIVTVCTAIIALRNRLVFGFTLLVCVAISQVLVFAIRMLNDPIFGNQAAVASDKDLTARNGAILDVHVIADSWNSSKLSVICGYSKQLHALTNIPIRITRPRTLRWVCRVLAVVLTLQAALLAAVANAEKRERWSSLLWLGFYLLMLFAKKGLNLFAGPENLLEKQPASVEITKPLVFSGRRAALVFISMLPVSYKANRWAWWDVFLPNNDRRREFHAELESSALFNRSARWQEEVSEEIAGDEKKSHANPFTSTWVKEAASVLNGPECKQYLERYLGTVFKKQSKFRQPV
ncbi:hypothetical protein FBEOM_12287 [Fusarium beomiforme]|uniref:Uncharacterized protein n=1 Tax=Fusarium beomiforme TaxID=44412 RepID=A0A9P5A948_9HYPO|nr:hypothetical protein FBEOM_12287 [Fusarium beomiforme]